LLSVRHARLPPLEMGSSLTSTYSSFAWVVYMDGERLLKYCAEGVLEALLEVCSLVRRGLVEAPYRLKPHVLFKAYTHKALHDTLFRSTLLNIPRYMARRDLGPKISTRLTRRSY